jgi:hypothetical protein
MILATTVGALLPTPATATATQAGSFTSTRCQQTLHLSILTSRAAAPVLSQQALGRRA